MVKKYNNISELINVLNKDMKMTHDEISTYVGVTKYIISLWQNGKSYASQDNYEKVHDMVLRLSGRNIKYPRQAFDTLVEEDEV